MGLYVQSLANIPTNHHRDYFIYLLDYGWGEPLGETLLANYEKMATLSAENKAVVIRGTRRVHFEDEVLSWHNINGENADEILPAILITNRHPHLFKESYGRGSQTESDLKLVLIPLKLFCKTTADVEKLIDKLFTDIIRQKDLSDFKIAKEIQKGFRTPADAIILEPRGEDEGVDFKQLISFLRRDEIIEKLKTKLPSLIPATKRTIESGLDEFYRGNYVSSVRILYPAIEEIVNQILIENNEIPTNFSGLTDKLTRLKNLGKVENDLIQAIKIASERNPVLHGNYNPIKQELVKPLCYSSITFLTELIV
jgi:hypothetical protein